MYSAGDAGRRRAVIVALSGARKVYLIDGHYGRSKCYCRSLGKGLWTLVVGAEIAVIALGGVVAHQVITSGRNSLDEAIAYLRALRFNYRRADGRRN